MTLSDYERERAAEARVGRRAFWTMAAILLAVWVVSATSILIERDIEGVEAPWLEPWVLEGTSMVVIVPLFFFVRWVERLAPVGASPWMVAVPVHLAGSLVFAAITIAWMGGFRALAWPVLFDHSYDLFNGKPVQVVIYEYRKLLPGYVGPLALIFVYRQIAMARLELDAARQHARSTRRLTLKCGGRVVRLEANRFVSAKAAGNYVEIHLDKGQHLARITLVELENQLVEAGIDAVRVHRSWLVNQAAISEIKPTGEGDVTLTLNTGRQVPGSRRYRDRIPSA
ncbi:LytTR family DNA-binding domain-containing protein [Hyphobacterium sp.]|uniref:LytTR family DNA-binding domain-containing protein n=1 Tax=Hyphobacterium sp. TaxID=2004662 RepID=UPI003B52F95A